MKHPAKKIIKPGAMAVVRPLIGIAAIIILALVILKFVFHIDITFIRTRLTLQPTALKLEDIQDIEFLMTAEYFGEVIGTTRDFLLRKTMPEIEKMFLRLREAPDPAVVPLSAEEEYQLNALRGALIVDSNLKPKIIDQVSDLKNLLALCGEHFQNGRFAPEFTDLVVEQLQEKRNLAYLARGSVQAGFDLRKLGAEHYFYCPSSRTVFLQMDVDILSNDINPWFIHDPASETYVKGFEIISESNIDVLEDDVFEFIGNIKAECKQRLQDDALRAGLKVQARESAEQTLKNLFSMFQREVLAVRIVTPEEFSLQKASCSPKE
jgi:hypothetical protein